MTTLSVTVNNPSGLHARPAASFSQFCNTFSNIITLIYEGIEIDPKSIILLMSSGIRQGAVLEVCVRGDDHERVCNKIIDYIKNLQD